MNDGKRLIRAGGGVVWRPGPAGPEVLLVHRPRYDDWSLPKGKANPGEDDLSAALREVEEETGLVCEVGAELPSTTYVDHNGRPKIVRYWAMTPVPSTAPTDTAFIPNDEVDEVVWVPVSEATARISYDRDRPVLAGFAANV